MSDKDALELAMWEVRSARLDLDQAIQKLGGDINIEKSLKDLDMKIEMLATEMRTSFSLNPSHVTHLTSQAPSRFNLTYCGLDRNRVSYRIQSGYPSSYPMGPQGMDCPICWAFWTCENR